MNPNAAVADVVSGNTYIKYENLNTIDKNPL